MERQWDGFERLRTGSGRQWKGSKRSETQWERQRKGPVAAATWKSLMCAYSPAAAAAYDSFRLKL